jgi:hypothetical protein
VNPKVVPLPRPRLLNPAGGNNELPREFRFAVSWETLLAIPQPQELTQKTAASLVVAPPPVMAPTYALQVVEPPSRRPQTDEAAWEMVVPKMVRK